MTSSLIRWPARYAPDAAPIHVFNELTMAADAAAVWGRLVRAGDWPSFYDNAAKIRIEGGAPDLSAGVRFSWRTFGVDLKTEVLEFEPPRRIAWLALGLGVEAYHAWLIQPLACGGSHVITEETQYGFAARAGRVLFPGRMEQWHQRWLEGLAEVAS